ncbi:MAG: FAD-dependent oxidoreductase [Candidatus Dependentiae bacterium]
MKKNVIGFSFAGALLMLLSSCMNSNTDTKLDLKFFDIKKLDNLENVAPIVVLGSGPAGLCAALYGGRAGFDTVILEGTTPGGLLTQTTLVENWPGSVEIQGPKVIQDLKEQSAKWGAQFALDTVEKVDFTQWPFKLFTADGHEINALSVVLATGATPRYLDVPGEQEFWGRGVTTCAVCDAPFYKDEDVIVIGGGDSAAEEAMQLAPYAKNITILVRKDHMRASAAMQNRLKEYPQISIRYNVQVKEILGDDVQVTGVTLFNNKEDTTEHLPINGVFLAIGHIPNTTFLKDAITLTDHGHIHLADRTQETSVKGVFAAGDVADDRYRQAGVSAGHGISAGLDATFFLGQIGFNDIVQKKLKQEKKLYKPIAETGYEVLELNNIDEFDAIIEGEKPVIVDFYAEWCPTCMQMLPAFAAVAEDMQDDVAFIKVDADQAEEIMKLYHVEKVPTLLAFKDGQNIARYAKTMTKKELYDFAKSLLV